MRWIEGLSGRRVCICAQSGVLAVTDARAVGFSVEELDAVEPGFAWLVELVPDLSDKSRVLRCR